MNEPQRHPGCISSFPPVAHKPAGLPPEAVMAWNVVCNCGARGPHAASERAAINLWNVMIGAGEWEIKDGCPTGEVISSGTVLSSQN
jgi:hypothetical protein